MLKKRQKIGQIVLIMAIFVVYFLFLTTSVSVQAMSSTNYRVPNDSLDFGGNKSSSSDYVGVDTLGEDANQNFSSENYRACSGFQCLGGADFLSFSVSQGLTKPGSPGTGIDLGILSSSSIVSSNNSTINSIFVTADSSAENGFVVTVRGTNGGLELTSSPGTKISSSSGSLTAGDSGYGICVFSSDESSTSPSVFSATSPYNGSCNSSSHEVGIVDTTNRAILQSLGILKGGDAEIFVKAAISVLTPSGNSYQDSLIFIATATY